MTLDHFISAKSTELRLGQQFVISYCKAVNLNWEESIDNLWNLDGNAAKNMIRYCMDNWQWSTLPEIISKEI